MDEYIQNPEALSTERLLELLGPDSVYTHATGYSFYIENKRISSIPTEFLEKFRGATEQSKLLARVSTPWKAQLLTRYLAHLNAVSDAWRKRGWRGKHARHEPRTVTLLLRAAWKFVEFLPEEVCSVQAISSESLDRFIVLKPGHANALHSFVNYLNRNESIFQKLYLTRARNIDNRGSYILPEHRSDALLAEWLHPSDRQLRNALIGLFMLVYARTGKQVIHLRRGDFMVARDGTVTAKFGKTPITLDVAIAELLLRYLAMQELSRGSQLATDDYIFPGRIVNRNLSDGSITYFLRRYEVTAEHMFATAVANFYRNGLTRPKILLRTLGISLETALGYWDIYAPRVTAEMSQNASKQ